MCSSSIVIKSHNFKILLFLIYGYHHTLWLKDIAIPSLLSTPQFQTFTNLLIGIFGVSNPTYLFFEIGRNYVSIIVNIISNNTVLQCYLLWIFVSIRKLLQLIVCVGVSTPSYLKNMTPFFKIFLSLTPSHLLKVTKFLVEISQFKFLVITKKNIFIYKYFYH